METQAEFRQVFAKTQMGCWVMRLHPQQSGQNELFLDDVARQLIALPQSSGTRASFSYWYDRVGEGYRGYLMDAFHHAGEAGGVAEVQFIWTHPHDGDIYMRAGYVVSQADGGAIQVEGYCYPLEQVEQIGGEYAPGVPDGEGGRALFTADLTWGGAHFHTPCRALAGLPRDISDFPEAWINSPSVHPASADALRAAFREAGQSGGRSECDLQLLGTDKGYHWYRLTLSPVSSASDRVTTLRGILRDIGEQRRREVRWRQVELRCQLLMSDFLAYAEVDLTDNLVERTGGLWQAYDTSFARLSMQTLTALFGTQYLDQQNKQRVQDMFDDAALLRAFGEGEESVALQFTIMGGQALGAGMLTAHLYREEEGTHVRALLCLRSSCAQAAEWQVGAHTQSTVEHLVNTLFTRMARASTTAEVTYQGFSALEAYYDPRMTALMVLGEPPHRVQVGNIYEKRDTPPTDFTAFAGGAFDWLADWGKKQVQLLRGADMLRSISAEAADFAEQGGYENLLIIPLKAKRRISEYILCFGCSKNIDELAFAGAFASVFAREREFRNMAEELEYAYEYSVVTGLPSRQSFVRYEQLYQPDRLSSIAVVTLNINALGEINKRFGMQMGDKIVESLAAVIRTVFGADHYFHMGGDDFVIAIEDASQDELEQRLRTLDELVNKYNFSVAVGHVWDSEEKQLTACMNSSRDLMQQDKQMYYAAGAENNERRTEMMSGLLQEVEAGEFQVYLQPQVDLRDKNRPILGAEALVRCRSVSGQLLTPDKFISILEANYVIGSVDFFVLEEVFELLTRWKKEGRPLLTMSVNLSRMTVLERGFMVSLSALARRYDIPLSCIELEITESGGDEGMARVGKIAREIKKLGFRLALDDFGSKYSNLSILGRIPFDCLKIDRTLIWEMDGETGQTIVRGVLAMCRELGLKVVAEGIEKTEQANTLEDYHCDIGQGYLYGKPMPLGDFEALLERSNQFSEKDS